MKKLFILITLMTTLSTETSGEEIIKCDTTITCKQSREQFNPKTLIIFFNGRSSRTRLLKAVRRYKAKVIYQYRMMNGIAISIPDGKNLDASINYFEHVKGVISVQKDHICHLD